MCEIVDWANMHYKDFLGSIVNVLYPDPRFPSSVGLVVSVSASRPVGRGFDPRPGHTKDHHKNGTNCLPAWHAAH